jgi:hypothetical protein
MRILNQYIEENMLVTEYTKDGETVHATIKNAITEDFGGQTIVLPRNPLTILQEQVDNLTMTADQRYKALDITKADVETVRAAKIEQLKEQCTEAIYKGFTSVSLEKEFGFNDKDQDNFSQQYLLVVSGDNNGEDVPWKTKTGVTKMTELQFRVLVGESKNHKVANQTKYWQLEAKVLAAKTNAEVDAVVWA